MSPAELMFARKIKFVFNRLLPKKKRSYQNRTKQENMKYFKPGDKVFLKSYKKGKEFWQDGIITQRVGKMYMVKSKKLIHKRHLNQFRRRFTEEISKDNEEPMEVLLYDLFDIPTPPLPETIVPKKIVPKTIVPKKTSKRKRTKEKDINSGGINLEGEVLCWKPSTPLENELFLLVELMNEGFKSKAYQLT